MNIKIFCLDEPIGELDLDHIFSEREECFIGRSPNSAILLDHPKVSRLHAKLLYQDGQYYFCDLGSGNGSVVRDESVAVSQNYLIQPGDQIRIADFVLLLESVSEQAEDQLESDTGDREPVIAPEGIPEAISNVIDTDTVNPDVANADVANIGVVDTVPPAIATPIAQFEENDQELEPAIEAEVVNEESFAIVRVEPANLDESPAAQTRALLAALNQRVFSELKTAGSVTRETYLKAVQKARESLEQNKLIDPEQFEREAEKYWQSISQGTSQLSTRLGSAAAKGATQLGNRLGAAAKAAWREFLTSQSDETSPSDETSQSDEASQSDEIKQQDSASPEANPNDPLEQDNDEH